MSKRRRSFLIFLSWLSLIFSVLIFCLFIILTVASFRIEASRENKIVAWLVMLAAAFLPSVLLFLCSIFLKKTVKEEGLLETKNELN